MADASHLESLSHVDDVITPPAALRQAAYLQNLDERTEINDEKVKELLREADVREECRERRQRNAPRAAKNFLSCPR